MSSFYPDGTSRRPPKLIRTWEVKNVPPVPVQGSTKQRLSTKSYSFGGGNNQPQQQKEQVPQYSNNSPIPHYVAFYNTNNARRSRSSASSPTEIDSVTSKPRLSSSFDRKQYHSKKPHYVRKKKVTMVDASTQTTSDAATQTSDEEYPDYANTAIRKMSSDGSTYPVVESFAFQKPTKSKSKTVESYTETSDMELNESTLLSNLHDLEDEIARIRYRALSFQESFTWLSREKNPRPTRPVLVDTVPTKDKEKPKASKKQNSENMTVFNPRYHSADSVLTVRPSGINKPPSKNQAKGPDPSKFNQISSTDSAFKRSTALSKLRISKSMDCITTELSTEEDQ